MTCTTIITVVFLLARASSTLYAQASDTILPNPNAVQLRKVWEVTGRPLHYDQVGYAAGALPDLTGDSINEFAVYVPAGPTEYGTWKMFSGDASALSLTPIWRVDSLTTPPNRPVVGHFWGDQRLAVGFTKYRFEVFDGSTRLFYLPSLFLVHETGIDTLPSFIVDPMRLTPPIHAFISDVQAVELDTVAGEELILILDGARRGTAKDTATENAEIWIYGSGNTFSVDSPTVIIRDRQTNEFGSLNVSFVHLDGDQKLDMVIGARQAGGARLKFYFSDDNSPYSWATRPPDREIPLYPKSNVYLDFVFIPVDLDGDHRADFVGKVYATTGPPAAIYLFLSGSGKDYRSRSFTLDDADQVLPTRTDAYLWRAAGYLNDSSRRFEMLPLVEQLGNGDGVMLLSGGKQGPNRTYDAYYFSPTDGIIGRAMGPLGDVTGDAWPDMITGDERWGAFVDQGIAMVLAGGPYIPTDDPTTNVQEVPIAQRNGGLFLWPNPVRERLTIAWRGDLRPMPQRFELYDPTGRYVAGGEVDPSVGSAVWHRGTTPSGTYFLRALDNEGRLIASAHVCLE